MKFKIQSGATSSILNQEGKGLTGCIVSLVLLGLLAVVGFRVGPNYFACKEFEGDIKTEVSHAGANFYDDETIIRNVLILAKKNELRLDRENVKVERFGQQMRVTVRFDFPVDLFVYKTSMTCEAQGTSYIGRL